jgi:hypothetical protein
MLDLGSPRIRQRSWVDANERAQSLQHGAPDSFDLQEIFDGAQAPQPGAQCQDRVRSLFAYPRQPAQVFDAGGVEDDGIVR